MVSRVACKKTLTDYLLCLTAKPWVTMGRKATGPFFSVVVSRVAVKALNRKYSKAKPWVTMGRKATGP
jgi:hypothetical protein